MAICLAIGVRAQIRNSEVLFFHYYDDTADGNKEPITNPEAKIQIIRIKNGAIELHSKPNGYPYWKVEEVIKNIKSNLNYYNNVVFKRPDQIGSPPKYDANMSNSKWTVWSYLCELSWAGKPDIIYYYGLKNDLSEYTEWREPDVFFQTDGTEQQYGRRIFKGYTKNQLLKVTLGGKRDFLQ